MKRLKSWEIITENGNKMRKGWQELADKNNLKIHISGIPSLSTYSIEHEDALKFKTYITQEMLKKGILASTNFYASIAHKSEHFENYFSELNEIFMKIHSCINSDLNIDNELDGPVCHSGFRRLN
jgi:glutamate-1-semialdehyde aminotransferase